MVVDSHITTAQQCLRTEREAVDAKLAAFDEFVDRVSDVATEPSPASSTALTTTSGVRQHAGSGADAGCREVRTAFAETVRPHSVEDGEGESLLETIRAELGEQLAVALAPTTDASFTPTLRQGVLDEARARRAETETLDRVLARETQQLDDASALVEDVTAWLADVDETPLTALGFDALAGRQDTLASYRARCADLAERRQAFLDETTNRGVEVGVSHRSLCPYLYGDLVVDHPVLATVASLDAVSEDCQRAVREHLVRRV